MIGSKIGQLFGKNAQQWLNDEQFAWFHSDLRFFSLFFANYLFRFYEFRVGASGIRSGTEKYIIPVGR
jgi:hypothetical protein